MQISYEIKLGGTVISGPNTINGIKCSERFKLSDAKISNFSLDYIIRAIWAVLIIQKSPGTCKNR